MTETFAYKMNLHDQSRVMMQVQVALQRVPYTFMEQNGSLEL